MFQKLFSSFQNKPSFTTDGYSIAGKKPVNEDSYLIEIKKDTCLLLVADGVGGHGHGDWASQTCIAHLRDAFQRVENLNDPKTFLQENTLKVAQIVLRKHSEDPSYKNCGTTLTGFLIQEKHYYVINIGDSRTYAWTPTKGIRRLTKDHSVVQQMIDAGTLTEEEAMNHPYRTTMTSAIGQPLDTIKVEITGPFTQADGEILLSFSDGVHDYLTDAQISQIISSQPTSLAQALVDQAFAAGSTDNITACWLK